MVGDERSLLDVAQAVGKAIREARRRLEGLDVADRRKVLRHTASMLGLPEDSLLGMHPEDGGV